MNQCLVNKIQDFNLTPNHLAKMQLKLCFIDNPIYKLLPYCSLWSKEPHNLINLVMTENVTTLIVSCASFV